MTKEQIIKLFEETAYVRMGGRCQKFRQLLRRSSRKRTDNARRGGTIRFT